MKKSLMIAAATVALSVSSAASALNVNFPRVLSIAGFPTLSSCLGVVSFTALGRAGQFCEYLMDWESPFNPNDVTLCIVREVRTPVTPSCILNENADIISTLLAGPAADTYCAGFNLKGEAVANVSLILGEGLGAVVSSCGGASVCGGGVGGLRGVAIFPTGVGLVYPIAA